MPAKAKTAGYGNTRHMFGSVWVALIRRVQSFRAPWYPDDVDAEAAVR